MYFYVILGSYLLGSIPFGYILVRLFTGSDVRSIGSGNIGATNVARTGKKGLAIATLALDAAKGYLAVCLAMYFAYVTLAPNGTAALPNGHDAVVEILLVGAIAALAAVVGHIFTVWLKFKGGKGVATGLGVFLALSPKAVLVALAIFIVILVFTKYVSLGSILSAAVFPFSFWFFERAHGFGAASFACACAAALLIIVRHKENIQRLIAGTENKFGAKKKGEVNV